MATYESTWLSVWGHTWFDWDFRESLGIELSRNIDEPTRAERSRSLLTQLFDYEPGSTYITYEVMTF